LAQRGAAILIHELLHVVDKIPRDGKYDNAPPDQSIKNQELVRDKCFDTPI